MPTNKEVDAEQFADEYVDVKEQLDKLRDGVLNAGPSDTEQHQALAGINQAVPEFFLDLCGVLANYGNNQPDELDAETIDALAHMYTKEGVAVRTAAFNVGADVIGGAVNDLGISLRVNGNVQWEDKTPDATPVESQVNSESPDAV